MSTVRRSERIVHVHIAQLRELTRERGIVLFLLGMEAQILQ